MAETNVQLTLRYVLTRQFITLMLASVLLLLITIPTNAQESTTIESADQTNADLLEPLASESNQDSVLAEANVGNLELATEHQVQNSPQTTTTSSDNNGVTHIVVLPDGDAEPENQDRAHVTSTIKELETTTDSTESSPTESSTAMKSTTTTTSTTARPSQCVDNSYCLNGGTCVITETGAMTCLCPEEFYGARCQTRNLCKTTIADSMTGDQICARLNRDCFKNDRFFRCSCLDDEYFIFKPNLPTTSTSGPEQHSATTPGPHSAKTRSDLSRFTDIIVPQKSASHFSEGPIFTLSNENFESQASGSGASGGGADDDELERQPTYLAECRKIDRCLGVRCKQMSEVCRGGACICDASLGYVRDPKDGLCKLMNPCLMPTPDGSPICGQARCVATLDKELYKCVCPIGYQAVKQGNDRRSTQCVLLTDLICDIPLLNKCQHICHMPAKDQSDNRYKCSCLPGYKSGSRPGIDDHLCFFDELLEQSDYLESARGANPFDDYRFASTGGPAVAQHNRMSAKDYVFRVYTREKARHNSSRETVIPYDESAPRPHASSGLGLNGINSKGKTHQGTVDDGDSELSIRRIPRDKTGRMDATSIDADEQYEDVDMNELSAQDRCNMYCEENKICVLESGSSDSYRCVCDRQGYVSVGDRCLDWCSAAEFSYKVRKALDTVCYSGVCQPSSLRPARASSLSITKANETSIDLAESERKSSWRPSFECDCSSSPMLYQDAETKLCKIDFQALINPCLPGNEGYVDCVENKNAYCAVLYDYGIFLRNLLRERPSDQDTPYGQSHKASTDEMFGGKGKTKGFDKNYICVCSPEKKFLVDKPRNKARCVDECDLLNNECGRFNRMCRAATIDLEDFKRDNLISLEFDLPRMNFKRTGCECLPGFNVGPTESIDFTLDDNNRYGSAAIPQQLSVIKNVSPNLPPTEHIITKYININSRCLLDYDVVEFTASFKAPVDFDPRWIPIRNATDLSILAPPTLPNATQKPAADQQRAKKSSATPQQREQQGKSRENSNELDDGTMQRHAPEAGTGNRKIIKGDPGEIIPAPAAEESRDESEPSEQLYFAAPSYMSMNINDLHKAVVFVGQCEPIMMKLSLGAYQECIIYRYWIMRKLRNHFADWRKVLTSHLKETFDLMEGDIRLHVNKCEATIRSVTRTDGKQSGGPGASASQSQASKAQAGNSSRSAATPPEAPRGAPAGGPVAEFDPHDPHAIIDADVDCELTLHSASDKSSPRYSRKVLLEKQLQKFIFTKPSDIFGDDYYLMAPKMLVKRETFDHLAEHRRLFSPCKSSYDYCDKQTKCEMVDTVNFTCTCEAGYTPIGSRDLYLGDSRKEVCEDINECLFDICKDLENSTCINEIGDYRCQCDRHFTGDNKRYCTHVCNTIPCKHGKCRLIDDHHAFCECDDGYKEADCSVLDPSVALRKANMIICGAIFASVLLLAITLAISLNSQLKRTKKKLRRLEAANEAANMFDLSHQQPFRPRMSKVSVSS